MPTHLKEYLDFLVEEALDEKLRGGFDLNYFKKLPTASDQKTYADKTLTLLNCGSARCSYILSSGKVLKLLVRPEYPDTEQNEGEISAFKKFGPEYVPRIFDFDENNTWLIVEPARTFSSGWEFKEKTGLSYHLARYFETYLGQRGRLSASDTAEQWQNFKSEKDKFMWSGEEVPDWESLTPLGQQYIEKHHHLNANGLIDITRADHWGWASDGRLVCVDPGISTE